jgi:Flp pilus assembly protein TadG
VGRSGQALVEFALIIPTFMILLLGLLEFGFMFDHTMTISYATREGARSGAAFASGNTTTMTCTTTVDVDKNIVAAVQRVMTAPGSIVAVAQVAEIRIYRALADGSQDGTFANTWTYSVNATGVGNGPKVDGVPLLFVPATSGWNACTRDNGSTPDSLGVLVRYQYRYITPLASVMGFFGPGGAATTTITDRTVMALNPTK